MSDPKDAATALARAYSLSELVSADDPRLRDAVETASDGLEAPLELELRGRTLHVDGRPVPDTDGSVEELARDLGLSGVRELRIATGAGREAFRRLIDALRAGAGSSDPDRSARRFSEGIDGVEAVFGSGRGEPAVASAISTLFGGGEPGTGEEALSEPALEELVDRFLKTLDPERAMLRSSILAAAEREDGGAFDRTDAVERLALAALSDDGDPSSMELARELFDPASAAGLVERIGATREEERRSRLTEAAAHLGPEMAGAVARALGEAEDRGARSSYIQAMVTFGNDARPEVLRMLDDSRWFVLRNGVRILAEMGTESDVQHLTAPLAHENARVRQETVRALARIGGEDAAMLLQGMLDDPDAEVRSAVANALGTLGSERTVKLLLDRLEKEDAENAQVQILRALGALGDPGAVPAIEKRAVVSFFSRPPQPVRVAAFRALASIGTPHALELVRAALDDRDEAVKAEARSLLDARESREG